MCAFVEVRGDPGRFFVVSGQLIFSYYTLFLVVFFRLEFIVLHIFRYYLTYTVNLFFFLRDSYCDNAGMLLYLCRYTFFVRDVCFASVFAVSLALLKRAVVVFQCSWFPPVESALGISGRYCIFQMRIILISSSVLSVLCGQYSGI